MQEAKCDTEAGKQTSGNQDQRVINKNDYGNQYWSLSASKGRPTTENRKLTQEKET
jgi:hypothetical protein